MRTIQFANSSNIASAELGDDGVLAVTFKNEATARYKDVTPEMMTEWKEAKSAGSWFYQRIRSRPKVHPELTMASPGPELKVVEAPAPTPAPVETPKVVELPPVEHVTAFRMAEPVPVAPPAPAPVVAPMPDPIRAPIVSFDLCTDEVKRIARVLYEAYITNSHGLAWNGLPCPPWDKLGDSVRSHWAATAIAASVELQTSLIAKISELENRLIDPSKVPYTSSTRFRPWRKDR